MMTARLRYSRRLVIAVFLTLVCLGLAAQVPASEKMVLQCEVLEVSPGFRTGCGQLSGVHYLLLHHANAADRQKLSGWLRSRSGSEVIFTVAGSQHEGVLCRLHHCFGRGLLLYTEPLPVHRNDLIQLILPSQSP